MNDQDFWKAVSDMGWAASGCDYKKIGSDLKARIDAAYEPQQAIEIKIGLDAAFRSKVNALYERLDDVVDCLGGDSFDDLIVHIVGLGEAEYAAVMADPSLGQNRALEGDYQESFAYCFHAIKDDIAAASERAAFLEAVSEHERGEAEWQERKAKMSPQEASDAAWMAVMVAFNK
jgi:hypothetical protein